MATDSQIPKVVIIGGGFAGLSCFLALEKSGQKLDLTLVDSNKDFEYAPSYHEALLDSDKDRTIRLSLRKFAGLRFINNKVTEITDTQVITDAGVSLDYDFAVIATGSSTNYFGNESFQKYGMSIKSLDEVKEARKAIAKAQTITVVGGGYTGIEIASMLMKLKGKKIKLVHSRDRVLHMLNHSASDYARKLLEKNGVELILEARAKEFTADSIKLEDGREIPTNLIIFSSGVRPNTQMIPRNTEITKHLQTKDRPNVFVCGDAYPESALPTAHNAMIEGRYVAKKILGEIKKDKFTSAQNRDWRILAIALGPYHGMITIGDKGYPLPFLTGFAKWLIERRVMLEFEKKTRLPL